MGIVFRPDNKILINDAQCMKLFSGLSGTLFCCKIPESNFIESFSVNEVIGI